MTYAASSLRAGLQKAGARTLLFDLHGSERSGADLAHAVDRLAGAVCGIAQGGPRIGLWYRNSFAAVEAFLAVEWVGGTRIPVDPNATAAEAAEVFRAAGVDLILADLEHAAQLDQRCFVHDDRQPLLGPARSPLDGVDPERTLMVYPRTVTYGALFGVPLSYANWAAIIDTNIALYRSGRYGRWDEPSELFLAAQQIMHGTGFLGTFPFLAMGLPQVLVDVFDATTVLAAMKRCGVSTTMFVPVMLKNFVEAVRADDGVAPSLRHLLYGGGPTALDDILGAIDLVGPVLTQVYGRVEGGWPIAVLGPEDHAAIRGGAHERARSFGRPIAEVEVALRLPASDGGEIGELMVRGPMAASEYCDPQGWCSLGDIVRQDGAGYLYFERRSDRMINTGYHVYPEEIEAIIAAVDGVSKVRVSGERHPRWGQTIVAHVMPTGAVAEGALIASMRGSVAARLAKYKVPREFRIVGDLPPE
jgi:acyl-CoA synthetase (AMP-forming)/AMP-acid ligase II